MAAEQPNQWPVARSCPALAPEEVQVWLVEAGGAASGPKGLTPFLHELLPEERERAAKFRVELPRVEFVVTRAALRRLLASHLRCESQHVRLQLTADGKPMLAPSTGSDLRFNVSHSHGMALIALARAADVGIDLEQVRPDASHADIAERFFSPREWAQIRPLPGPLGVAAFYRCWTRKEAFLKAQGAGLGFPLDQFEVTVSAEESPKLVWLAGEPDATTRWSIHDLPDIAGYGAALVCSPPPARIHCFRWTEHTGRDSA